MGFLASLIGRNGLILRTPTADGTAGQVLKTDGSGNLSFTSAGVPGGASGQLQYNNNGSFNGVPSSLVSGGMLGINVNPVLAQLHLKAWNAVVPTLRLDGVSGATADYFQLTPHGGTAGDHGRVAYDGLWSLPNVEVMANGTVKLVGATSGNVQLKAAATTTSYTLTLPANVPGVADSFLTADTDAVTAFVSPTDARTLLGLATSDTVVFDVVQCNELQVSGDTVIFNSEVTVQDPLLKLGEENSGDVLDLGIYAQFTAGVAKYTGIFRDASDGLWRLFTDLEVEPTTTVDTAGTGYAVGTLVANLTGNVTGDVSGDVNGVTLNALGSSDNYLGEDGVYHAVPLTAAAGSATEIQYRDGGAFGAIAGSSWDEDTVVLPKLSVTSGITGDLTGDVNGVSLTTGGSSGDYLGADGSYHTLTSSSPAGSGTELQYRNGSSFGAISGSAWDGTTLTVPKLSSVATNAIISASVSDTNRRYLYVGNQAVGGFFGIESSAAGTTFTNTSAYSLICGTAENKNAHFATNSTVRLTIANDGLVGINKASSIGAQLHVVANSSTTKGLVIDGAASQSATLLEVNSPTYNVFNVKTDRAEVNNNSGTPSFYVRRWSDVYPSNSVLKICNGLFIEEYGSIWLSAVDSASYRQWALQPGSHLTFGNTTYLKWSANQYTIDGSGADADIALYRKAAGVLEINSGTAGTHRDLALRTLYAGNGTTSATPTGGSIYATGGSGTDIVGGNLTLAAGISTGAAAPASVLIQTTLAGSTGSTAQTLATAISVKGTASTTDAVTRISSISAASALAIKASAAMESANSYHTRFENSSGTVLAAVHYDGRIMVPAGGATGPAIFFSGDTYTGIYKPFAAGVSISSDQRISFTSYNSSTTNYLYAGYLTSATPRTSVFSSEGGSGTNIAGGAFTICSGAGTGTGVGGDISFKVALAGSSGSAVNSHSTVGTISGTTGGWSITAPAAGTTPLTLTGGASQSVPGLVVRDGSGYSSQTISVRNSSGTENASISGFYGTFTGSRCYMQPGSATSPAYTNASYLFSGMWFPGSGQVAITTYSGQHVYFDLNDTYWGNGVTNAAPPTTHKLQGTGGSGTNIAGTNITIAPGKSTGSATPAVVKLQGTAAGSSGTTAQTLADVVVITNSTTVDVSSGVTVQGGISKPTSIVQTEVTSTPSGTTQTVDWTTGNLQTLDLGSASGNVTLTFTAPAASAILSLLLIQGATARDITWPGTVVWDSLGAPTWTGDTNKKRWLTFRYNGTNYYASVSEQYA